MIAQFKFLATYLLPGAWLWVLTGGGWLLASFGPPPPGSELSWALNFLAWVGVLNLVAGFALIIKKLFGRQPSLSEILSGLVTVKTLDFYKEEQRLRCLGLEKQISETRHSFDERANSDLVRYERTSKQIFSIMGERDQVIGRLRDTIGKLEERTESHIRKFDQLDGKIDRMIERATRAIREQ